MTFDWLTYIDLASRLIDNRESDIEEAYLRASISRAYYGVFGTLWAKLGRKPWLSRASKHHIVVMLLRNSTDPFIGDWPWMWIAFAGLGMRLTTR